MFQQRSQNNSYDQTQRQEDINANKNRIPLDADWYPFPVPSQMLYTDENGVLQQKDNPNKITEFPHAQGTVREEKGKLIYTTKIYTRRGDSYRGDDFDTLYSISKKYNIPLEELLGVNTEVKPEKLYQGQEIILSVNKNAKEKLSSDKSVQIQVDINKTIIELKQIPKEDTISRIDKLLGFLTKLEKALMGNATQKHGFQMYGEGTNSAESSATKLADNSEVWGSIDLVPILDAIDLMVPRISNKPGKGVVAGRGERMSDVRSRFIELDKGIKAKDSQKVSENIFSLVNELNDIKKESVKNNIIEHEPVSDNSEKEESYEERMNREMDEVGLTSISLNEETGYYIILPIEGSLRSIEPEEANTVYKNVLKYATPAFE